MGVSRAAGPCECALQPLQARRASTRRSAAGGALTVLRLGQRSLVSLTQLQDSRSSTGPLAGPADDQTPASARWLGVSLGRDGPGQRPQPGDTWDLEQVV